MTQRRVPGLLGALAVVPFSLAVSVMLTGGFVVDAAGLRLSVRSPWRALIAGLALLVIDRLVSRRRVGDGAAGGEPHRHAARWLGLGAGLVVAIVSVTQGAFVASGADASGYVSQSQLWAALDLRTPQPLARQVHWPEAEWTLSPLGYRPATVPDRMVPTYAPGFPALMGIARSVGGPEAVYVVVPLCGLLLMWVTYRLGFELGGPWAAALAACSLLVSPTFLHQVVQPMSDVPAAALWSTSLLLGWRAHTPRAAALAGLAASAAITVRPNLAPLAIPIALVACGGRTREGLARLLAFGAGVVPGAAAVAAVNWHLYGSPLASGYGPADKLFGLHNLWPNAVNYGRWLLDAEPVLIVLALASPIAVRGAPRTSTKPATRLFAACLSVAAVNLALYLPYLQFDHWSYLRFLLPAFPALAALAAATVAAVMTRAAGRMAPAAMAVCACAILAAGIARVGPLDVFGPKRVAGRFARAAEYVNRSLPPGAVIVCKEHSGALAYYTRRAVVRYDYLHGGWLDGAIAELQSLGRPVYFVLDEWEVARVRERFAGQSVAARLDWRPAHVIPAGDRVVVFSAQDRRY